MIIINIFYEISFINNNLDIIEYIKNNEFNLFQETSLFQSNNLMTNMQNMLLFNQVSKHFYILFY